MSLAAAALISSASQAAASEHGDVDGGGTGGDADYGLEFQDFIDDYKEWCAEMGSGMMSSDGSQNMCDPSQDFDSWDADDIYAVGEPDRTLVTPSCVVIGDDAYDRVWESTDEVLGPDGEVVTEASSGWVYQSRDSEADEVTSDPMWMDGTTFSEFGLSFDTPTWGTKTVTTDPCGRETHSTDPVCAVGDCVATAFGLALQFIPELTPPPNMAVSPDPDVNVNHIPTLFWDELGSGPRVSTGQHPEAPVTVFVRTVPSGLYVIPGDGSGEFECAGLGEEWDGVSDDTNCSHTYRMPSDPQYLASVSREYSLTCVVGIDPPIPPSSGWSNDAICESFVRSTGADVFGITVLEIHSANR